MWLWALGMPGATLALAWPTAGWSLLGFLLYALPLVRGYRYGRSRGWSPREARLSAVFCLLGKLPELVGSIQFYWRRLLRRSMTVIEYKGDPTANEVTSEKSLQKG